jgi:(p)ppGpp synthase/HD superfamily hydrolase
MDAEPPSSPREGTASEADATPSKESSSSSSPGPKEGIALDGMANFLADLHKECKANETDGIEALLQRKKVERDAIKLARKRAQSEVRALEKKRQRVLRKTAGASSSDLLAALAARQSKDAKLKAKAKEQVELSASLENA